MATADQILSLIRNHLNNDDTQFRKVVLQISAVEARSGHAIVARTIQELLNQKKTSLGTVRLVSKNKDIDDLLLQVDTYDDMTSLVLSQELKEKLDRVIKEYLKKETLSKYGLANRRKLLLYGASGTGKTMTASALSPFAHAQPYLLLVGNGFLGANSAVRNHGLRLYCCLKRNVF